MRGYTKLIDDKGRDWDVSEGALAKHLGTTLSGSELVDYAVVNLGFVNIGHLRRAIGVRCRPALVTGPALAASAYALHDQAHLTLVLSTLGDTWQDLILRKRSDFVQLIGALTEQPQSAKFWRGARHISGAAGSHKEYFQSAAKVALSMTGPSYSEETLTKCLDALFKGRWSLCELDPECGQTIVKHIGNSYTPFNPGWLSTAKNTSLCAYGDEAYGLWVAQHHRKVQERNDFVIDEVDAIVSFPRIGDARLRYSRLTAPVSLRGGRRMILTAACSNSGVDLRKVARHKAG